MERLPTIVSRMSTEPAALQTRLDTNPTLIVSWWCTIFSLVVIFIRIFGRWIRTEKLFREDKVMLWSIIPLLVRMAFVHPVLIWGTNNTQTADLTAQDIYHRSIGSRLVLGSRIWYAVYIWVAKITVLEFVQRIIGNSWTLFYERGSRIIYSFLALTFVGVVVATLAECHPISHYWQVVPDPGHKCRDGAAQLITMGACDIVTDVVLMAFPIPLVIMSKMPLIKKVSLVLLFLLSLVLIAITGYRIPGTMSRQYDQQFRSLLASLEILAATLVANVIVIGSFLRDKGVKKVKFRAGSFDAEEYAEGSILSRPATRTVKTSVAQRHWGSDEDLVRDLGLTISHDLRHETMTSPSARLAPVAEPAQEPYRDLPSPQPIIAPQGRGLLDPAWNFRKSSKTARLKRRDSDASSNSSSSTDLKLSTLEPYTDEPASPGAPPETPYKKMSFFDVGGLADNAPSEHSSMDYSTRRVSQVGASIPTSRSGQNFLADVGGLMGSQATSQTRSNDSAATRPNGTGFRSSLLTPDQSIRERSTSSETWVSNSRTTAQDFGVTGSASHDFEGPNSLNISDAGGLLK